MPHPSEYPANFAPHSIKISRVKPLKIPVIVSSRDFYSFLFFCPPARLRAIIFNYKTGKTHGIKFRINPPIKAINSSPKFRLCA